MQIASFIHAFSLIYNLLNHPTSCLSSPSHLVLTALNCSLILPGRLLTPHLLAAPHALPQINIIVTHRPSHQSFSPSQLTQSCPGSPGPPLLFPPVSASHRPFLGLFTSPHSHSQLLTAPHTLIFPPILIHSHPCPPSLPLPLVPGPPPPLRFS